MAIHRDRLLSIVVLCIHTLMVLITLIGFFTLDPLVPPASLGNVQNNFLDVSYSILHAVFCIWPSLLLLQSMRGGQTRGLKKSIIVSSALVLIVQASKLASLSYAALAGVGDNPAPSIGPWVVTLILLGVDIITMMVFLALSLSLQLNFISGKTDTAFPWLLVWCIAHFLLSSAAFLIIADLDPTNVYLTFAGGISVLYALLLFLGGGLFPAYYLHLRAQLDGTVGGLELLVCIVSLVPWVVLDGALIGVAQLLGQTGYAWYSYFAVFVPCLDVLACITLAMTMVYKYRILARFNPEIVELLPGSAARHNDL